jgi:hypothetical protein
MISMKKKTFNLLNALFCLVLVINSAKAQDSTQHQSKSLFGNSRLVIKPGIGFGLDYGGIGIKAEFVLAKWLGVFGGFGYNLISAGYNAGTSFKLMPQKRATPVILAMYGYNAGLKIKNVSPFGQNEILSKTYYGFTVGAGVEVGYGKKESKACFSILVPFRSKEFHDTYDSFENSGVKFNPPVLPIAITIGLMF